MRHTLAFVVVGLALTAPGAAPAARAADCANDIEQRNVWHAVHAPAAAHSVAQRDADPCVLLAGDTSGTVWRSDDGGTSWTRSGHVDGSVAQVVLAGVAARTAYVITGAGTLEYSSDDGRTFAAAGGLTGQVTTGVYTDPTDGQTVYAVVRPAPAGNTLPLPVAAPAPSIYKSTDFGHSFTPLPGSAPLQPAVVAVDPRTPDSVWADSSGATAGLWESKNGGTAFQSVTTEAVHDVDVVETAGGGSLLLAATDKGIYRTATEGQDSRVLAKGQRATAVAAEHDHSEAFLALLDGQPWRTADEGQSFKPVTKGLPRGCKPVSLTGDISVPTTFLLGCADGTVARWRSDGADFGARDELGPSNQAPLYDPTRTKQMKVLKVLKIGGDGQNSSGVVAFDGQVLYYVGNDKNGVIHRVKPDGTGVPDLLVPIPDQIRGLTYDSRNDRMFAVTNGWEVWSVDLRTHRTRFLFSSPKVLGDRKQSSYTPVYTYDPSIGRFRAIPDISFDVYEINIDGSVVGHCTIPNVLLGGTGLGPGGGAVSSQASVAGMVASGDGGMYAQLENDTTVLRLSRSCEVRAIFDHPRFSESLMENDDVACDTTSFPTPAIWLRDSNDLSLTAFEVPGGYCPLATKAAVTTAPLVPLYGQSTVCANLRLAGRGDAVVGQPMSLLVGGYLVATVPTDASGTACAPFLPARYPGLVAAARSTSPGKERRVREPVLGTYAGSIAYRPAVARTGTVVTSALPPLVPVVPVLPKIPPLPALLAAPLPPPPPPAQIAEPVVHPQPQPQPQYNPQAQANPQGQPGLSMAEQEQPQLAYERLGDEEYAMSRREPETVPPWWAVAVGVTFAAAAAHAVRTQYVTARARR